MALLNVDDSWEDRECFTFGSRINIRHFKTCGLLRLERHLQNLKTLRKSQGVDNFPWSSKHTQKFQSAIQSENLCVTKKKDHQNINNHNLIVFEKKFAQEKEKEKFVTFSHSNFCHSILNGIQLFLAGFGVIMIENFYLEMEYPFSGDFRITRV